MNRHLSDAQLVDALEETAPRAYREHLERCGACRDRFDGFRATLLDLRHTAADGVPEPSPLFWEHFSQRVHDAIAEGPAAKRPTWIGWVAPAAAVFVLFAGALLIWIQSRSHNVVRTPQHEIASAAAPTSDSESLDLDNDDDWALVRVAAEDLEWDAAVDAGLQANPGSAERVALEMSVVERQELERLIEAEIKL
jgi:hypothetical protein